MLSSAGITCHPRHRPRAHPTRSFITDRRIPLQSGQINPDIDEDIIDDWSDAVEDVFWPDKKARSNFYSQFGATDVFFLLPNSVDSAISESVAGDIILIAIAVVVICSFVGVVFFLRDAVFTRSSLALLGCLCIALSIGSGFGLSFYLGIPFTSITQVRPCLAVPQRPASPCVVDIRRSAFQCATCARSPGASGKPQHSPHTAKLLCGSCPTAHTCSLFWTTRRG